MYSTLYKSLYNNEILVCLAYDRYIKLWDTETGECVSRFTSRKIPYCAKFHPDDDKQHLFVAGTSDKKIICVSQQNIYVILRSIK
jgi:WD domain, G-beta repeat.